MKFKKGDKVKMTDDALENYGVENKDKVFIVEHAAHSYMPSSEFYSKGMPHGYHPGYDNSIKGQGLYDLKGFNSSLYDYELIKAQQYYKAHLYRWA